MEQKKATIQEQIINLNNGVYELRSLVEKLKDNANALEVECMFDKTATEQQKARATQLHDTLRIVFGAVSYLH